MSTLEVKAIQAPTGYDLQMPAGHILQVVSSTFTGRANGTQTTPTKAHADCGVNITPISTSSKILITVHAHMSSSGNKHSTLHLYRDSSELSGAIGSETGGNIRSATGTGYHSSSDLSSHHNLVIRAISTQFLDSPSSTSSLEYSYRVRSRESGYEWTLNRPTSSSTTDNAIMAPISTITLMEVAG